MSDFGLPHGAGAEALPPTRLVVPCYDEARRLAPDAFDAALRAHPALGLVLVNDGSGDATLELLHGIAGRWPGRVEVIDQQPNRGKAEAVRVGMQRALEGDARYAGYWDADLATPLDELPRFVAVLESHPRCEVVLGARVKLLGRSIERRAWRHYLGRIFATVASETLGLAVYDTQCGAKLFRNTPAVRALFAEPFRTTWIFDVEILARMIRARRSGDGAPMGEAVVELPLLRWHDVRGSKVRPWHFAAALGQMATIWRVYLR